MHTTEIDTKRCDAHCGDWLTGVKHTAEILAKKIKQLRENEFWRETILTCLSGAQMGWINKIKNCKKSRNTATSTFFLNNLSLSCYLKVPENFSKIMIQKCMIWVFFSKIIVATVRKLSNKSEPLSSANFYSQVYNFFRIRFNNNNS